MRLTLKNIAKVRKADVEINGITVIAGENDTGKSTVGKALYSVFNSLYHVENQIKDERVRTISNLLDGLYLQKRNGRSNNGDRRETAEKILDKYFQQKNKRSLIKEDVLDFLFDYGEADAAFNDTIIDDVIDKIEEILAISNEEILKRVITTKLSAEFNRQINNVYSEEDGVIQLRIQNDTFEILASENQVKDTSASFPLKTEIVYLDDPFILDEVGPYRGFSGLSVFLRHSGNHRDQVRDKLTLNKQQSTFKDSKSGASVIFFIISTISFIEEILADQKLDRIYEKIDSVCDGQMISTKRNGLGYQKKGTDKVLDVKNISTGLKTFVILKTLLMNGTLEENGTIILDEPEIHLHPQWQLLFAELIVLIQKEFNMHILLNTHSPYFLQAIEVYAAKYEIADKCKYYLAQLEGDMAVINDVSDSTETIYKLLAKPFQDLENVRYEND